MFKKELSAKLLQIIDERKLTVQNVADLSNLSRRYVTSIISEKQTPSISVLENLCAALETTPDELLINEKSKHPDKAKAVEVVVKTEDNLTCILCPICKKIIIREYQAYCDACGQKLSWRNFVFVDIKSSKDTNNGKSNRRNTQHKNTL